MAAVQEAHQERGLQVHGRILDPEGNKIELREPNDEVFAKENDL
jgi:hypothetical protein